MRHTFATLLLEAGVHPQVAPERLGHTRIEVTLEMYSHVLPPAARAGASVIDRTLGGQLGGQSSPSAVGEGALSAADDGL